jgi:hypothetical protein
MKMHKIHTICANSLITVSALCMVSIMTGFSQQPQNRASDQQRSGSVAPDQNEINDRNNRPNKVRPNRDENRQPNKKTEHKALEIRIDADGLRLRLNRSILRAQEMIDRSQAALAKLDDGATPVEVLSQLRVDRMPRESSPGDLAGRPPQREPRPNERAAKRSNKINPEERDSMHAFLETEFPEMWMVLEPMLDARPEYADQLIGKMASPIREILLLQGTQPELASIKTEEMRAGFQFVEARRIFVSTFFNADVSDSEKAEVETKLRIAAENRFDAQLRAKQFEVEQLETRLKELQSSVDDIENRREEEIQHMVDGAHRAKRARPKP